MIRFLVSFISKFKSLVHGFICFLMQHFFQIALKEKKDDSDNINWLEERERERERQIGAFEPT